MTLGQQKSVTGTGRGQGFLIGILRVWGWDGHGRRQTWTALGFLPSLYCSVDLEHPLNPVALAVIPMSPNYRKTMPKLDSLDYICINWINTEFQAMYCLLPQAKDIFFFLLPSWLLDQCLNFCLLRLFLVLLVCLPPAINFYAHLPEAGGCMGSACTCLWWYQYTRVILLPYWIGSDHCSLPHAYAWQPVVCSASS